MRGWWFVTLGAGLLCLHPGRAAGYCLTIPSGLNKPVAWSTTPVTYHVSDNLKDAALLKAIDDAFKTWEAVTCSTLKFTQGAQFKMCTESDKTKCAAGTVHFEHGTAYIYIFWYDATNKAAFPTADTNAYYNFLWFGMIVSIEGVSLAVNGFKYSWDVKGGDVTKTILDVQNEMIIMVGSVIGLTNSTNPAASMYPNMKFGDITKRSLHQDDIDGLTYLYLDKANTSCKAPPPPGASGCSGTAPAPDGANPTDGMPATDGLPSGDGPTTDAPLSTEQGLPLVDQGAKQCTSTTQCASDEVCTSEGFCVKTGGDDDGCGCRVGGLARADALVLLAMLGLMLALLRRRR